MRAIRWLETDTSPVRLKFTEFLSDNEISWLFEGPAIVRA